MDGGIIRKRNGDEGDLVFPGTKGRIASAGNLDHRSVPTRHISTRTTMVACLS